MVFLTKNNCIRILFGIICLFCFSSCDKEEETFSLNIKFKHLIDNEEIVYGNDNMVITIITLISTVFEDYYMF